MKITLNENLVYLAKKFLPHAKLYLVGGSVRDLLLNKKPKDYDICSKITINQLQKICESLNIKLENKNFDFGTATICYNNQKYDYAKRA